MPSETLYFPDDLYEELTGVVEEVDEFDNMSQAARYYIRSGLQREAIDA